MKDLKTIRGMPDLYDLDIERISRVENICMEAVSYTHLRAHET